MEKKKITQQIKSFSINLRLRAIIVPAKAATPIYTALGRISSSLAII